MTQPRTPPRKLNQWTDRWDHIENMAADLNDALPTLLAASACIYADAFPTKTVGSETHAIGDHADPTFLRALANLEPQQRDAIAEHLREVAALTHEIRGHLRRATRLKDIITNRKDPRTYDTGGDCKACHRYVSGAADDRLRAHYCEPCYRAWCRYRNAANERGEAAAHHLFEKTRRAQLDRENEEAERRRTA